MGTTESKDQKEEVKQLGDQQVTVIENQQIHTEYHTQHDVKLWVILVVTTVLLVLKILKTVCRYCKKQALKAAGTVSKVQNI